MKSSPKTPPPRWCQANENPQARSLSVILLVGAAVDFPTKLGVHEEGEGKQDGKDVGYH